MELPVTVGTLSWINEIVQDLGVKYLNMKDWVFSKTMEFRLKLVLCPKVTELGVSILIYYGILNFYCRIVQLSMGVRDTNKLNFKLDMYL